jgi:hypothetical protein
VVEGASVDIPELEVLVVAALLVLSKVVVLGGGKEVAVVDTGDVVVAVGVFSDVVVIIDAVLIVVLGSVLVVVGATDVVDPSIVAVGSGVVEVLPVLLVGQVSWYLKRGLQWWWCYLERMKN